MALRLVSSYKVLVAETLVAQITERLLVVGLGYLGRAGDGGRGRRRGRPVGADCVVAVDAVFVGFVCLEEILVAELLLTEFAVGLLVEDFVRAIGPWMVVLVGEGKRGVRGIGGHAGPAWSRIRDRNIGGHRRRQRVATDVVLEGDIP